MNKCPHCDGLGLSDDATTCGGCEGTGEVDYDD